MLTGVCKLTVGATVLPPRSFVNFGNSNGSLHGYNLAVMAYGIVGTRCFCNSFQNNNILNCSRVQTK